jgi:hypothetical protein
VPIDDLARLLADALCNNIGPCCAEAGFPFDSAQCHATAETGLRSEIDRSRTANVTYNASAARTCLDAYTATIKACHDEREIGSACKNVFTGTLQPGQTCTSEAECAPGASCRPTGDGGASQCAGSTLVRGKLGDGCNATCTDDGSGGGSCSASGSSTGGPVGQATCYTNDGLYCDDTHICATMPAQNQPCTTNTICAGEAYCDNGLCAAKHTSGSCGQLNDGCASTAYCDTATQQCQLRKSTGAVCTISNECPTTDTCNNATCRTRTIASASACRGNL